LQFQQLAVQAEMCVGGLFMFSLNILNCPYFPFDISGKIYFRLTFKIEADLGFASFEYDLAAIELGLEAGLSWYEGPNYNACTWVQEWDGFVMPGIPSQYQPFRRRRRNRRRWIRSCRATTALCDFYITAYLRVELFGDWVRVQLEARYWFRAEVLEVRFLIKIWAIHWSTGGSWYTLMDSLVYRREFGEYSGDDNVNDGGDDGCQWSTHNGFYAAGLTNDRHVYTTSHEAKVACVNMGTTVCRAVTCCFGNQCGQWGGCTLRAGWLGDSHLQKWTDTARWVDGKERRGMVPMHPSRLAGEHTFVPRNDCLR